MLKKLLSFLIIAGIITVIFGTIYGTVQQNYRQSAWDPQVQMAEDTAQSLSTGGDPTFVQSAYSHIDMSQSLQPFIIVYDSTGKVVVPSATLGGTTPTPPLGVLNVASQYGEDRLTWQPRADARISAVIIPYRDASTSQSGFVLAGRNLREVEVREDRLSFMVFIGWFVSMLGLGLLFILHSLWPKVN